MALSPVRGVLHNGVTVIAKANHTTPAVSLLISVNAGGFVDPLGRDGTSALVARLLDRGTAARPASAIADGLDRRGASLSVTTGRHQLAVSATCLSADFRDVLAMAADITLHPTFPEDDLAVRRAELVTMIKQDEDQPSAQAVDAFMRTLYGEHPYARRVRGTVAAVESLTRAELTAYHAAWFAPSSVTVVVVGDVPAAIAVDEVGRLFGAVPAAAAAAVPPVPNAPRASTRLTATVPMPDKAQADVAYGFVGIRRADAGYFPAMVMNNALGQYALGGRLGDRIRERQGMAYYVFSSLEAGVGEGPLLIRAGVAADNVGRTIASIDAELRAVVADGLTAKEVDESKRYLVGSLPRQLETNAGIASFLWTAEVYGLGLDYDVRLPDLIRAVTHEAANGAARRLLDPDRATIAVAGPVAS